MRGLRRFELAIFDLQTFREEERLESLALVQVGFQPHAGGVQGDSLGEGQDGLYVQLVGPLAVLVHLGQGEGFVQLVLLVLVGLLVDRLLVDEGFQKLILATLQLGDLALGGLPLGFDVLLPGVPDVEDDPSEEGQELRARPELLQDAQELGFQLVPRDVRPAAVGRGRAVIIGVAPGPALRPGACEGLLAVNGEVTVSQAERKSVRGSLSWLLVSKSCKRGRAKGWPSRHTSRPTRHRCEPSPTRHRDRQAPRSS
jgi:hypothetical protein